MTSPPPTPRRSRRAGMTGSYGEPAAPLLRENDPLAPCPPQGGAWLATLASIAAGRGPEDLHAEQENRSLSVSCQLALHRPRANRTRAGGGDGRRAERPAG